MNNLPLGVIFHDEKYYVAIGIDNKGIICKEIKLDEDTKIPGDFYTRPKRDITQISGRIIRRPFPGPPIIFDPLDDFSTIMKRPINMELREKYYNAGANIEVVNKKEVICTYIEKALEDGRKVLVLSNDAKTLNHIGEKFENDGRKVEYHL